MNNKEIVKLQALRRRLERQITDMIKSFETETGFRVSGIEIARSLGSDRPAVYISLRDKTVSVEAQDIDKKEK